jgi:hypothetical protein
MEDVCKKVASRNKHKLVFSSNKATFKELRGVKLVVE